MTLHACSGPIVSRKYCCIFINSLNSFIDNCPRCISCISISCLLLKSLSLSVATLCCSSASLISRSKLSLYAIASSASLRAFSNSVIGFGGSTGLGGSASTVSFPPLPLPFLLTLAPFPLLFDPRPLPFPFVGGKGFGSEGFPPSSANLLIFCSATTRAFLSFPAWSTRNFARNSLILLNFVPSRSIWPRRRRY